ncbi:hypothetical protein AB1L30_01205 [Bremerella sp. JC817]|uniref:hypothetical protein n=1 Tax=Bremerella sp. JC817 TaxID=3231756 RepID=UPI00345B3285
MKFEGLALCEDGKDWPCGIDAPQYFYLIDFASQGRSNPGVTAYTFRRSLATHLTEAVYDFLTVEEPIGHSDVRTTVFLTLL